MPSFTRRTRQAFVLALILCAATANAADRSEFHTSFEAGEPALLPHASDTSFHIEIAGGPSASDAYTAKPGVGFTGLHSLHYQGHAGSKQAIAMFDVDVPVQADTQLSYLLFPCISQGDLADPSTYVAVDLEFDDGSHLSATAATDQHRIRANAHAFGASRTVAARPQP